MPSTVLVDDSAHIRTITLHRPDRLNALNAELLDALADAFENVPADLRTVVIRGAGRAFSSGHDLKWAAEEHRRRGVQLTEEELTTNTDSLHEVTRRIRRCPLPVIARVHGYAIGGGAEIALSADLVVASESAVFRFTETAVGLVVTNGFTALLPRTTGPAVAKEIIMLGEPFRATRALEWGLVNRVVPDDQLDDAVTRVIATLGQKSPNALRLAKNLLDQAWEGTIEDAMRRETLASVEASQSADAREAAAAFAAGRAPTYTLS